MGKIAIGRPFERPPTWVYEDREPILEPPGVWNWRYPQFTAGLLPIERKLDRRWRRGKPPARPAPTEPAVDDPAADTPAGTDLPETGLRGTEAPGAEVPSGDDVPPGNQTPDA